MKEEDLDMSEFVSLEEFEFFYFKGGIPSIRIINLSDQLKSLEVYHKNL